MGRLDDYLAAADRENTRRSYESAIRHYEVEWRGLLPATSEAVARYLADHAATHSLNTLRHRLAALARWHQEHGFPDPTKAPRVRQVLKGIRAVHAEPEKRARPLQLAVLQQVADWLARGITAAHGRGDCAGALRHQRDQALLLLGFWRGFRADELVNLRVEYLEIAPGEGLTCYLPRSKGDRRLEGRHFQCPALSRLCPVSAVEAWLTACRLTEGPLFRKVDRWGRIAADGLQADSLIPLLRRLFAGAGVATPEEYSSHSLRRGFAGWARSSGWDLKELMEYVGWRDVKSAMRYLQETDAGLKARFERGLAPSQPPTPPTIQAGMTYVAPASTAPSIAIVHATIHLMPFIPKTRGLTPARRLIEATCLARYGGQRLDADGTRYELSIPYASRDELDESVYVLLDDLHRVADANRCFLETSCHEPATDAYWD